MKKIIFTFALTFLFVIQACEEKRTAAIELVSPQEVYDAVHSENKIQLIDVRTVDEYTVSHLKTAQNICVTDKNFKEDVKDLDKNKPVYVYCKKGGRSAKAAKILTDMGFTKVYDLQGGITNWEDKGLEMEE